jgi:transglutaminase-like putative cysteine protease
MKLRILHRTSYTYGGPVRENFNETRLQPVSANGQVCEQFILKVLPATRLTHYRDFYMNYVHLFEITEPHSQLVVEATSIVTTEVLPPLPEDHPSTPLVEMGACSQLEYCYDFLQSSRYVEKSPEVWRTALDITSSAGATTVWQAALAIMHYIYDTYTYAPASTNTHTHMQEVFRLKRGVCQDFAHVMLGLCRAMKIPARYISGYLYNGPAGQLRGAQSSHAWVEVYLPGLGWRGLDPTNNAQPGEHYIKTAVGRDYADVSPVKGTYRGTTAHKLAVEVIVTDLSS